MTGHETTIENVLASHDDEITVHDELHAVPPHRVHAVTVDGRRAVCKIATGPQAHLERDARVLQYVGQETSLPVPEVLAAGDGYYVAEWLDTVPDPDESIVDATWARTAGAGLARLHEETTFDAPGVPRPREGGLAVEAHETVAGTFATYLEELRDGIADTGYADVIDDVVAFLDDHQEVFEFPGPGGEPVLCHGNWLPDHVGIERDEIAAVIDFERALVGPAEHDYWRAALPLFHGGGEPHDAAREAFRRGYESVRSLPPGVEDRRELHRLVVVASFVESLFVQDQHGPEETERRAERLREHVDGALADLEAALS